MSDPLAYIEDKYEILGKLNEGGMGTVYKVRHRLLGEIRVIKVMRRQFADDPAFVERFNREAHAAIRLRHQNIAQLFDFAVDEAGNASMVLEYVEGLDLKELLRRGGPPPLGITLEIAVQALQAIAFLHRRGMVHRDVSPDNLMLSRDEDGAPVVKLIDLGIIKVLDAEGSMTTTGVFLGKVRYASPEQFRSAEGGAIDHRSDLYSIGVVLYELLTGTFPITGDTSSAIMAGHLYRPPVGFDASDPDGRVPDSLRRIVLRLLEKDPARRFQSADELIAALRALQDRLPWSQADLDRCCPWAGPAAPRGRTGPDALPAAADHGVGGAFTPTHGADSQPRVSATAPTVQLPEGLARAERAGDLAAAIEQRIKRGEAPEAAALLEDARREPGASSQIRRLEAKLARLPHAEAPPGPRAGRSSARTARVVAAVAALVALVAAGAFLLAHLRPGGVRPPAAGAALLGGVAPATARVGEGTLVVHALPWAMIEEIRNAAGSPVALPDDPVTPLSLALPAGDYTVVVRHPSGGAGRTATAHVAAGRTAVVTIEVVAQDPDSFLAKMGW